MRTSVRCGPSRPGSGRRPWWASGRRAAALTASLVLTTALSACADSSQLAPSGTSAAASAAADDTVIVPDGGHDADALDQGRYLTTWQDPPAYRDGEIEVAVTGLGISDATHPTAVPADIASYLDDEVRTVVVFEVSITNTSGETASVFANMGELLIGDDRVKAKPLLSDRFGREVRHEMEDSGVVLWTLTTPFEDALAVGEARLEASAPIDPDSGEPVAAPVEVTVSWETE